MLNIPTDDGRWIARLWAGSDRADFNEPGAEVRPGADVARVFINAAGKA